MGALSKIQWCDHTYNEWWGCTKVDRDCKNCYADTLANRWGFDIWGVNAARRFFPQKHHNEPLKWNKEAAELGIKAKVFCGSMMDWAEDRPDLKEHQQNLFKLIENTPNLIWQMLTKRPSNAYKIIPASWHVEMPDNIWMGTSVGHNKAAYRIDEIKALKAKVTWLSCEPMTEALEISTKLEGINWVVCGGESGNKVGEFKEEWATSLLKDCQVLNIPFFMKQFGSVYAKENKLTDKKGGNIDEFPTHLQIREFPISKV